MTAPACAAWQAERSKAFAVLAMKPDLARVWWGHLDHDTRRALLRNAGLNESAAFLAWDGLKDTTREALRPLYEKRRRLFNRLSQEFPLCTASL